MIGEAMVQKLNVSDDSMHAVLFGKLLQGVTLRVAQDVSGEKLQEVLEQIRAYFFYGSAFMYELEPSKGLVLQKHVELFEHNELPLSFFVEHVLNKRQISNIVADPLGCTAATVRNNDLLSALKQLFNAQSLFAIFILDDYQEIIGCVGVADSRAHSPLSSDKAELIRMSLSPVVEKARFRIYKRRLDYTSATLESIMDHIGFDIYVNDFDTHEMLYANKSMAKPYGGWENMRGKPCFTTIYDDKTEECEYCPKKHLIDENGFPSKIYSWDYQRPFDGRWFRVISAAFQWTDGRLAHVISSTDINDAKKNELLVEEMAYFDSLTGIPNRRKLEKDFNELIDKHHYNQKPVTVLFLDLDGFKAVNDHYGHSGGDALLRHISDIFSKDPLTKGRCYRYGGDEFIFMFDEATDTDIKQYKSTIGGLLNTPFVLDGEVIVCAGSIGSARYPDDGATYWTLLDKADDAMYENKQDRKGAEDTER